MKKLSMVLKEKVYQVIFEHDTFAGKFFDLVLILMVVLSVVVVMLETVQSYWLKYQDLFSYLEWFFTTVFTIELCLRVYSSPKKLKYLLSFYGLIDLISILPSYLVIFFPSAKAFIIVRSMRILRLFRILKLSRFVSAGSQLQSALSASREKIIVFTFFITIVVVIMGSAMFYIESPESGFTSIPASIYWAIVTMTTVGYGDIAPVTALGKFVSSILMLTGYGIIAVPTGIISAEIAKAKEVTLSPCCKKAKPEDKFCSECGKKL